MRKRLTDADIHAIRKDLRHARTAREVARKHGISDSYICQIKHYTRRAV